MEIEDALHNAILILKEGMDGALDENLIEDTQFQHHRVVYLHIV